MAGTQISPSDVLNEIHNQRRTAPLSILALAEPILTPQTQQPSQPSSQSQNAEHSALSPSSLTADLAHYRDLFSKLRFSYLEQVTKEKYLRGIVGEPPILVTSEQNAALEEKLVGMKSVLQGKKRGVEALVSEMEGLAREIASKYDGVELQVRQLEVLPGEIESLEAEIEEVKRQLAEKQGQVEVSEDPRQNLSMGETERLLEEQRRRNEELQKQIEQLQQAMPGKIREVETAEKELEEIERRRNEVTRLARESRRVREEGGRDLLEEQGRWYKSSEIVMKGLLGVHG